MTWRMDDGISCESIIMRIIINIYDVHYVRLVILTFADAKRGSLNFECLGIHMRVESAIGWCQMSQLANRPRMIFKGLASLLKRCMHSALVYLCDTVDYFPLNNNQLIFCSTLIVDILLLSIICKQLVSMRTPNTDFAAQEKTNTSLAKRQRDREQTTIPIEYRHRG